MIIANSGKPHRSVLYEALTLPGNFILQNDCYPCLKKQLQVLLASNAIHHSACIGWFNSTFWAMSDLVLQTAKWALYITSLSQQFLLQSLTCRMLALLQWMYWYDCHHFPMSHGLRKGIKHLVWKQRNLCILRHDLDTIDTCDLIQMIVRQSKDQNVIASQKFIVVTNSSYNLFNWSDLEFGRITLEPARSPYWDLYTNQSPTASHVVE
jgi:hypothetical protein